MIGPDCKGAGLLGKALGTYLLLKSDEALRALSMWLKKVSALSAAVGRIVDALKLKRMWNNTILVFAGDNGGSIDG